MPDRNDADYFRLFNEIGILEQLSRAFLEAQLPKGLIAPHFAVLNHLIRVGDGRTPLQLARAFQVPKTSMTHTLAGLEKHGLVKMRPNPDDARSKQVWLQEAGRSVRDAAITGMGPDFAQLRDVVTADDLAQVLPVLERLRKHLDAARD
ncbi:MarR family transcriptional regulator [Litoreibacter ponti]|uniref:MarR family transcriptional regulator n=1 Tax=Litoreibacter ponti TaxID=1510457 RepID=A0A2T6BF77_9RHOB|nr:MarR family transcriptional regulator [Litoreibacter ponti]PTX54716.1 MarR family transcriptional regulator [Litoreibacter ponti]